MERVSRKPGSVLAGASTSGRLSIWDDCYQLPLAVHQKRGWKKVNHDPCDLAPNRGLPSQYLSILLVRSYRTFAPLPVKGGRLKAEGGI